MSRIYEVLYEWQKTLDDGFIDEENPEIEVGGGRYNRTVQNHIVRVRGGKDGVPVVVSWEDWFNTAHFTAMNAVYDREILEVFVGDKSVKFEGMARRRGFMDKLLGLIGMRRGHRPFGHMLFTDGYVQPTQKGSDTSEFDDRDFCQKLYEYLQRPGLRKVDFQAETGISSYFKTDGTDLSPGSLDEVVANAVGVLESRAGRG